MEHSMHFLKIGYDYYFSKVIQTISFSKSSFSLYNINIKKHYFLYALEYFKRHQFSNS